MIKKNWDDLTVADQMRIREIGELQTVSEDEKNIMVAALLSGLEYEQLLQMPFENLRAIMDNTEFLFHKPEAKKAKRKYELNGHTYKLFKDPGEMTVAQYISFQQIQADGFDKRPLEMLAIFLIPDGHQYNDGYDMEEVMDDMGDMKITDALGVCSFFTRRCLRSIRRIKVLSTLMLKVERLKAPKAERERIKATEIQLQLILEGLERLYGFQQ